MYLWLTGGWQSLHWDLHMGTLRLRGRGRLDGGGQGLREWADINRLHVRRIFR